MTTYGQLFSLRASLGPEALIVSIKLTPSLRLIDQFVVALVRQRAPRGTTWRILVLRVDRVRLRSQVSEHAVCAAGIAFMPKCGDVDWGDDNAFAGTW
jgi:hypothetical protein